MLLNTQSIKNKKDLLTDYFKMWNNRQSSNNRNMTYQQWYGWSQMVSKKMITKFLW